MNVKENRNKWFEALHSGKYEQTKEVLCNGKGGYCCLGVLCKVFEDETGTVLDKYKNGMYVVGEDTLESFPQVMEWVGLQNSQGKFDYKQTAPSNCLTELNDVWDWDFHQLADLIESEPEGLFKEVK